MIDNDNSSLAAYIRDIRSYPLIDEQEEKSLSVIIQTTNSEEEKTKALNKFVTSNLRMVVKIAVAYYKKIRGFGGINLGVMDLIQSGNIGLMRAAELFDGSKNVKFSSYAYQSIERYMQKAMKEARFIRIPLSSYEHLSKMRKIDESGKEITDAEMIKQLGIEEETFRALRATKNQMVDIDDFASVLNKVDPDEIPLNKILNQRELREYLLKKIEELRPIEKWVVFYRFFGNKEMTLEQIGEKFGVTKERIRRVQKNALDSLRKKMKEEELKGKGDKNERIKITGETKSSDRVVPRSKKTIKKSQFLRELYGIKDKKEEPVSEEPKNKNDDISMP